MLNQRRQLIKFFPFIMLMISLTACQSATAVPGVTPSQNLLPTKSPTQTPSLTSQEASPSNPMPTKLPQIINEENLQRIEPISHLGKGSITNPVQFSPDGSVFAVPATTGVFLYDTHTFDEVAFFETKSTVLNICFSPDGALLAVSGATNTVQIWKMSNSILLGEINIFSSDSIFIYQIAFSPDGNFLAVAYGPNDIVKLWGVQTGELIHQYSGSWFSFSTDSKYLSTTEYGREDLTKRIIHLYDLSNDKELNSWRGIKGFFTDKDQLAIQRADSVQVINIMADTAMQPMEGTQAIISQNGQRLALFKQGAVLVNDLPRGSILQVMAGKYSNVEELQFSADLQYLAGLVSSEPIGCCGGGPDTLVVWQVESGTILFELSLNQYSRRAAFSPDGQFLVLADSDRIDLISLPTGTNVHTIGGFTNAVSGITFSPNSQNLAAAYLGLRSVRIWDGKNGEVEKVFTDEQNNNLGSPSNLAYSPDGKILAANGFFWDASTGSRISNLESKLFENKPVLTIIAFHPDGVTLAAGFSDGSLRFWDYDKGTLLHDLSRLNGELVNLDYSPDGSMIAVVQAYPNFSIQIWKNEQYYPQILDLSGAYFRQAIFSPDGERLAVLSASMEKSYETNPPGQIEIWSLGERKEILKIGTGNITRIAYSPDGTLLAGGLYNQGEVQIWNAKTGDLLGTLNSQIGNIIDVAFSPDGTMLASASVDGTIVIWGIP